MKTKTIGVDPVVQRLRMLVQESPHLKDAAQIYEAILPLLRYADLHVDTISITREQARAKMETGLPLLHDLDLGIEAQAVSELMLQLAHAVETAGGEKGTRPRNVAARRIRMALEKGSLNVGDLLLHIAHGDRESVAAATDSLHLDPGLVWTLAQNALKPALRAWCRQLTHLAGGFPWHRGYCFICGAGATLGELQENNLVKHLRCGHCGADWPFPRLKCIYCGNEDHSTLGYFYQENQNEKHRVEVCKKCKGYIKIITTFSPTPPETLQVEDLSTLHLDYVAQEKGYIRVVIQ